MGASEVAKAYRFLRAVLVTATDDLIIPRNPCRIKGAGEEKPDERPVLTIDQVFKLVELIPERLRALVLLATFASLRWGKSLHSEGGIWTLRPARSASLGNRSNWTRARC